MAHDPRDPYYDEAGSTISVSTASEQGWDRSYAYPTQRIRSYKSTDGFSKVIPDDSKLNLAHKKRYDFSGPWRLKFNVYFVKNLFL